MFWVHVSGLRFRLRLVFRFLFVCLVSVSGFFWLRLVSFIFRCHAVSQHFIELLLGYSGLTGFWLACVLVNSFGFFWVLNEFCMCRWWSIFTLSKTQKPNQSLRTWMCLSWIVDVWILLGWFFVVAKETVWFTREAFKSLTAIPCRMHRISFDLRS